MAAATRIGDAPEQLPLPLPAHSVSQRAADFLVAASNRHAVEWIDRWPDWPFTALVVVGPCGSGKSHIAELWRAHSAAQAVDLATVGFEALAETASHGRPILLDDADRVVAGSAAAERMLLQLYNLVRAAGGTMLLTAATPPSAWQIGLADLMSRLNSAMVVEIAPPDDALLAAIALKQFADRQIEPAEGVIPYLLSRGERSFAAIATAVAALDAAGLKDRRAITVGLAREVLAGLAEGDAA